MSQSGQAVIFDSPEVKARSGDILFEVFHRRRSRNGKDYFGTLE
jgi:hypothetical protein